MLWNPRLAGLKGKDIHYMHGWVFVPRVLNCLGPAVQFIIYVNTRLHMSLADSEVGH